MTKTREYSVCEPDTEADACVIWLHGLGADGSDFLGVVDQLGLPANHKVRFVFPNAPFRSVTVNNGMKMRGWYDIFDINLLRKEDESGIKDSYNTLSEIIQHEVKQGVAHARIILAGFSQGGAMSLYTGLRYPIALGGIIVLSAYMPLLADFNSHMHPANADIPIFMAHGLFDPIVPLQAGKNAADALQKLNYALEWQTYPIAHTVTLDEIYDVGAFINRCLGYA